MHTAFILILKLLANQLNSSSLNEHFIKQCVPLNSVNATNLVREAK